MQIINYILVVGIIFSFVAYFYYKTKQIRATLPIRKKWYTAKAGASLGAFLSFFGCNTPIIYPTFVGFIIAALFIIVGLAMIFNNVKRAKHEGRFVQQGFELNQ